MIKVTIITTEDCIHCQNAKTIIDRLKGEYNIMVEEIDIISDKGQELIRQHNILSSPGILINDHFFSMGGVKEDQLKNKFEKLKGDEQ